MTTNDVIPLEWSFVVDGAPVPKARPRFIRAGPRAGHTYTPSTTTAFEAKIRAAAKLCGVPRFRRGVRLTITAYVPDLRAKDWDNVAKAVADALNPIREKRKLVEEGVAWSDDSQVTTAIVRKRLDRERPRTEVTISADDGGQAFGPAGDGKKAKVKKRRILLTEEFGLRCLECGEPNEAGGCPTCAKKERARLFEARAGDFEIDGFEVRSAVLVSETPFSKVIDRTRGGAVTNEKPRQ